MNAFFVVAVKPPNTVLWIIQKQKKVSNLNDEPMLCLHITGILEKKQF